MSKLAAAIPFRRETGGLRLRGERKLSTRQQPLISVITVVFNAVRELPATLRSIAGQHYPNVEYLIMDGGSSDGTLELIRAHDCEIDFWISEPDAGVYPAMNKAIDHARGEWLVFLGAGDVLMDCLHEIAPGFNDPCAVYYGDVYLPSRHMLYHGAFSAHKLSRFNLPHQATFYPKALFQQHRFDPGYPIMADYVCNIRAYCDTRYTFRHLRVLVAVYEDKCGISSCRRDAAFDRDHHKIIRDNFGWLLACEFLVRDFFRSFERKVLRKLLSPLKRKKMPGR